MEYLNYVYQLHYHSTFLLLGLTFFSIYLPYTLIITGVICLTGVCGNVIFPYWFIAFGIILFVLTCCKLVFMLIPLIIFKIKHLFFKDKLSDNEIYDI
jgi:hypothetical protein